MVHKRITRIRQSKSFRDGKIRSIMEENEFYEKKRKDKVLIKYLKEARDWD